MTARRHNSGTGPIAVIMQSIRANRQSIWVSTAHRTPDENNVSHGNIQGRSFCGAVHMVAGEVASATISSNAGLPSPAWRCAACHSLRSRFSVLAFHGSSVLASMADHLSFRENRRCSIALASCPWSNPRSDPWSDLWPEFGWGLAIETLEGSVEIRQVTKSSVEGDPRNTAIGPTHVGQHAVGARQPTAENELRECRSLAREQFPDVAIRNPMAPGDHIDRKLAVAQVRFNVCLDRTQARRAYATTLGNCRRVTRCAQGDGHQVAELRDNDPPHLRLHERRIIEHGVYVVLEQLQHARITGDHAEHGIINVTHKRA